MSNVAQKRPFSSLVDEEPIESTPPPSPHLQTVLMTPAERKWCDQTIKSLKKHKRAIAFLDPVDPVKFNIPDYFDIIKSPMDLGTIEKKLQSNMYIDVQSFKHDIQLVFDNCYLYNNPGDPVCLDAKKLEEQYHKLCKKEPSVVAVLKTKAQPKTVKEPSIPDEVSTTHHNTTPTSIALSQSPTLITIPTQPKTTPTTLKVKSTPSAHNPSSITQEIKTPPPLHRMPEDQHKRCLAIVKELKKPKYQSIHWPFLQPVDAAAWGATDYYDIIKHPMDMTRYEQKLTDGEYKTEDELVQDIRLMFQNCYLYNPVGHPVYNLGKEFEQVFDKQWAKIQSRPLQKKPSLVVKKRRVSKTDMEDVRLSLAQAMDISPVKEETEPERVQQDVMMNPVDDIVSTPTVVTTPTTTTNNNNGRSTILRLKLSVKPKEEEPIKVKPSVKVPGLALSKEPPTAPKLAISLKPTSPVEKKVEKTTPTVLQNHDKWLALAKKSPTESTHRTQKQPKEIISPHPTNSKPKDSTTPVASPAAFDIHDLYTKIHNEKKIKEQKKREEQEKWEKNERIRLEKEKLASEERMKQIREFNLHLQAQKDKERRERIKDLNARSLDISLQKMKFGKFETLCLLRDQDWRDLYTWQRDTIDYRHMPIPGFVKRAPISISELRKRLLSKCVRLENSKSILQEKADGGSDMDIE